MSITIGIYMTGMKGKRWFCKLNVPSRLNGHIRFWCTFRGRYKVEVMEWFIRKGDVVEEEKPKTVKFNQKFPVSEGRPQSYAINVYADSQSSVAPVHPTDNVKKLVTLTIDLSSISKSQWKKMVQTGNDKKEYYVVHGSVKVTFGSASTMYKLSCEWGLNATVKAEYAWRHWAT